MRKYIVLLISLFLIAPINISAINVTAKSLCVMETSSGRILLEKNSNNKILIASTTKIMTFIVAVENANLDDIITVGEEVLTMYGSNIYLELNEQMTLRDMLYGMMLRSGNDAATVIANYVGKGIDNFVVMMNEKAKELGMTNTIFSNPTGLDDDTKNYSTACDMALLSNYAFNNDFYKEVTTTKKYRVDNDKIYIWNNRNELLYNYDNLTSGKTGYTPSAGHTLVSTASLNSLNVSAVTLNDNDMYIDQENIYDYIFSNYEMINILDKNNFYIDKNYYKSNIYIKESFSYPLTAEEKDNIKTIVAITKKTKLKDNDVVGQVKVTLNDKKIYLEDIYVKITKKKSFWDFITNLF